MELVKKVFRSRDTSTEMLNKLSKEKPRNLWKNVNFNKYQVNAIPFSQFITNNII